MLLSILLAGALIVGPPSGATIEGPAPPELAFQPAPTPPGGYWSLGERPSKEPPDGDDNITVGSVLFSLGLLRAGAGGAAVYMSTRPDLCPSNCQSMGLFGWSGVGFGGLMTVTGIVMLAVGGSQRAEHERWQRGEAKLTIRPVWQASRGSASFGVAGRF